MKNNDYENNLKKKFREKSNGLLTAIQEPYYSKLGIDNDILEIIDELKEIALRLQYCNEVKKFNKFKNG